MIKKPTRTEEIQEWIHKKEDELRAKGVVQVDIISGLMDEIQKLPPEEADEYLKVLLPLPTPIEDDKGANVG